MVLCVIAIRRRGLAVRSRTRGTRRARLGARFLAPAWVVLCALARLLQRSDKAGAQGLCQQVHREWRTHMLNRFPETGIRRAWTGTTHYEHEYEHEK